MFGRLSNDRLQSAARALDEGRFDDAYKLLASGKSRPTDEAQALRARLADALMTRGQEHLMSRQFVEALADFDRAGACGVDQQRLDQWRERAKVALREMDDAAKKLRNADDDARVNTAVPQAMVDFRLGRLAQAAATMRQIAGIARTSPEQTIIEAGLRLAAQAAQALHEDRFSEAHVLIARIAQLGVSADWLTECQKQLDELQQRRHDLLSGPLGLIAGAAVPAGITMTPDDARDFQRADRASDRNLPRPYKVDPPPIHARGVALPGGPDGNNLPRRLILRIDGVGAFMLLRGDRVTIGRAGTGASADLELFADLSERQAQIIRAGEDYFIAGVHGVELAGRKVEHALLQHDDRIRLGSRVKLRFLRPSAKSVTSLLELGEGVRTTCESRRVILWGGPLIMSSSRDAHVMLPGGTPGVVLLERGGQLLAKSMNGRESPRTIELATPLVFGDLRMSLCAMERTSSPGKVVG